MSEKKSVLPTSVYGSTEQMRAQDYAVHYGDKYSQQYRNQFINDKISKKRKF